MTPFLRLLPMTVIAVLLVGTGVAAQDPPRTPSPQDSAPQVAIIGCVERAMTPPPDDATRPAPPAGKQAIYKLIDTQPGGGSPVTDPSGRLISVPPAKAPAVVDPQYWLAGPASIDFATYQNQRVEIIGKVTRPAQTPVPQTAPPDAPKSLLTVTDIRVVSTECK